MKLIVEPIFEADFHECSYGFRPNRNAKMAVEKIAAEIKGGTRSKTLSTWKGTKADKVRDPKLTMDRERGPIDD